MLVKFGGCLVEELSELPDSELPRELRPQCLVGRRRAALPAESHKCFLDRRVDVPPQKRTSHVRARA